MYDFAVWVGMPVSFSTVQSAYSRSTPDGDHRLSRNHNLSHTRGDEAYSRAFPFALPSRRGRSLIRSGATHSAAFLHHCDRDVPLWLYHTTCTLTPAQEYMRKPDEALEHREKAYKIATARLGPKHHLTVQMERSWNEAVQVGATLGPRRQGEGEGRAGRDGWN